MRVKLLHHGEEWLKGEVEPPAPLAGEDYLCAFAVRTEPSSGRFSLALMKGLGIWQSTGELIAYFERAADLAWSLDGSKAWLLVSTFGRCPSGPGVRHVIHELDGQSLTKQQGEIELCVESGGVRYLIRDGKAERCVATWQDQNEWGYVDVDLVARRQGELSLSWGTANLSPPAFSPSGSLIVSCQNEHTSWWHNERDIDDPAYVPSPGGPHRVGTISVHRVATGELTHTEVWVDLPAGWIPDRPDYSEWYGIWGPEFLDDDHFRIWLPDDSTETITLPLPAKIIIDRPLSTTRPYPD